MYKAVARCIMSRTHLLGVFQTGEDPLIETVEQSFLVYYVTEKYVTEKMKVMLTDEQYFKFKGNYYTLLRDVIDHGQRNNQKRNSN